MRTALDAHRAEVGDPGLMARVKWGKLVGRILAALGGPGE